MYFAYCPNHDLINAEITAYFFKYKDGKIFYFNDLFILLKVPSFGRYSVIFCWYKYKISTLKVLFNYFCLFLDVKIYVQMSKNAECGLIYSSITGVVFIF